MSGQYWDRVVVINLARRADRLDAFRRAIGGSTILRGADVQRFEAVTAGDCVRPDWWSAAGFGDQSAYWACRESHLRVWQRAMLDGVERLLVFEDDAQPHPDFDVRFPRFHAELPAGWLGYQLGGWGETAEVSANCSRMLRCGGLWAYALNAAGLRRAYGHVCWHVQESIDAATRVLQQVQPDFYMPPGWLVSHAAGYSDNAKGECGLICLPPQP